LAKKDVTVILNGAGGDEIFGGYPTLLAAQASEIYKKFPGWFRNEIIERLVRHLPTSHKRMSFDFLAKSFLRGADFPLEEAHRRFKEIFNKAERDELLTNEAYSTFKDSNPAHVFEDLRESFEKFEPLNRLMYLDFKVFMAHSPLHVCDITSSAHAVEARVPYLDKEMIEFSSRVPSNLKIKGLTTKYIVREALKGTLPPAIIKMKKKGFLIPGAPWIKKDLKPFILDIIGVAKKDHSWLFNFKYIDRLLEDHFSGRFDNTRKITCLVSFFIWHKMASPSWETQITNN
jgi:asparagine synthase (glutamine-hydrolysing)